MSLVYVNGELSEREHAKISVFDHGLVVGDGVFETILLTAGHPFALSRHLDRLDRSANGLGLGAIDRQEIERAVVAVVADADFAGGRIRVTVTSGTGPLGSLRGGGPLSVIVAAEPATTGNSPSAIAVVPWTRNENGALAGLKTTAYAENARALAWANAHRADEAIFANTTGQLCEGTGSNVFVVRDGVLLTPPLSSGCLAGVTRDLILERLDGNETPIAIGDFSPHALDEAFLTSSLRGVQPIVTIDGQSLSPVPGSVTGQAMDAYAQLLETEIDP